MGKRKGGVSNGVKVTIGNGRFGRSPKGEVFGPRQLAQRSKEAKERYTQSVQGLGKESRNALDELSGQPSTDMDVDSDGENGFGITVGDNDMGLNDDPGIFDDADGVTTIVQDMRDFIGINRWLGVRRYKDSRTWKRRIRRLHENWAPLMEMLTNAYIRWRYPDISPTQPSDTTDSSTNQDLDFSIDVVDIYSLARSVEIPRNQDEDTVVAIARAGYLATSPTFPSFAISFSTLELFRVLRLFKASMSIEAFAKSVCYLYSIPYRRTYRTALSDAFDIYLVIMRKIDKRVEQELGHDSPNYRVLNSCPACTYHLEGEPDLQFSRMWVVDGNNSLKRMKGIHGRQVADTRVFEESDYFLSEDYVNKFADEVKARPRVSINDPTNDSDDDTDAEPTNLDDNGDPTDGANDESLRRCTDNWKAAASDSQKRMWDAFHESGLFASACRHGLILWLADMIRSGELAKYPLAMVAKALETLDPHWLLGYDIGCSFGVTVANSSLGIQFKAKGCRTCVNAFHGYTHNAHCQRQYHPNNIVGMGIEDLETLERIFSISNQLASVTRFMSSYRRRVAIDAFFRQWDNEKYQNIATMLYNNYIQALDIIEVQGVALEHDLEAENLTEADLERFFIEEAQHMEQLGNELPEDLHAIAYVELLQKYREIHKSYETANSNFHVHLPSDYQFLATDTSYVTGLSETRKIETRRRYLSQQRDQVLFELTQMETMMGIQYRWEPSSPEYKEALNYMRNRVYQQSLEKLHRLVVQRLFELHKMNLSHTGYKMRTHISQALQKRSKAIRQAVRDYNKAARELDPPRDELDWSRVTHFSFLDQFDILRDTRHSVFDKPWAKAITRKLMETHRRVTRAREEIQRINVEVRRLHTHIVDEGRHFDNVLRRLDSSLMYGPVHNYIRRRRAVNQLLLERIHQLHNLDGFTGITQAGVRKGTSGNVPSETTVSPLISYATSAYENTQDESDVGDEDDDDELTEGVGKVVDFMVGLAL